MPSLFVCVDRGVPGTSTARLQAFPEPGLPRRRLLYRARASACMALSIPVATAFHSRPNLASNAAPWRRRTCSPSRGRCCSVAQRLLHSISAVLFRAYYFSNQRQYNLPWTLVVTTARHCNIAGAYFQFLTSGTLDSLFCASMTELAGPPPLLAERHPDWPNGTQIGPVGPGGRFGCVPSKLTNFTPIIYALGRPALDGHLDGHLDGVWTGKKITDVAIV